MTSYLTIGALVIALGAVTVAALQSVRLADAQADLTTVQSDLDAARSNLDRLSRERATVERVLADERDHAVGREIAMSKLQAKIASMAGTAADGPVAPVLEETIRGLAP